MKLTIKKKKNSFTDYLETPRQNGLKLTQKLALVLEAPRKRLLIWLLDLLLVVLLTIALGVFLGLFNILSPTSAIWLQNKFSFSALHSICIAGLCFIYVPFVIYFCLFLFGITKLHKSLFMQYLVWFFLAIAIILLLAVGITYGALLSPWDSYQCSKLFK